MRREFGAVRILSGYRTAQHNAVVGGAGSSWHVYDGRDRITGKPRWTSGVAADVACATGDVLRWHEWAIYHRRETEALSEAARGGIGLYRNARFVHLDTGPMRDWNG